ncbi:hypothetical protein EV651_113212 [Kribbella sp. VKM Ac-2571]|uniref:hypothetical protein n=1 Tax=Kribbella sp. VKM Ac-2571 TaxID=2512222 RepID=UPI0010E7EEC4|nr:hypothetical protein [Kribbella sp. VKM Ac-2571]TDO56186.1 hypothetical protein EV651_113212 [Kribbella sp. VKM Ac-2571]
MTVRVGTPARLAWSLWGLCVVLIAVALVLFVINADARPAGSYGSLDAVIDVGILGFPTVGAAIVARHPDNAIGWLLLATGLGSAVAQALLEYGAYSLLRAPGTLPGGAWAGVVADAVIWPSVAATSALMFALFPTGHAPSRRWRWLKWAVAVDVLAYVAGTLFAPGGLHYFPTVPNPFPATSLVMSAVRRVAAPALIPALILGLLAVVVRFRRSRGAERLQISWMFYLATLLLASTPLTMALSGTNLHVGGIPVNELAFAGFLMAVPLAVGVAILRYRLYDIDVVINRTLVYGALSLILAAAYVGSVLLLQLVVSPVTRGSGAEVAVSTLVVAGLFRPLRSRIQAGVDRRFFRSRYDAARTLEAFGTRLRDQLDIDALGNDLQAVVNDTVQPTHVSLWLRGSGR